MADLYEKWLSCGEDWTSSCWAVSLETTATENRRGCRRWMTEEQISQKYNSPAIAKEIVQAKSQPEFKHQRKPHPDLPSRKESHHYIALVETVRRFRISLIQHSEYIKKYI